MPYAELRDITLYYDDAGAGDPPVLLLHELGGSSESWRQVIPQITPHHRVIAPDKPRCATSARCIAVRVGVAIRRTRISIFTLTARILCCWPATIRRSRAV